MLDHQYHQFLVALQKQILDQVSMSTFCEHHAFWKKFEFSSLVLTLFDNLLVIFAVINVFECAKKSVW